MSYLCRVSGESIQFIYNIHKRKGGKGCSESLWELTAGAEKNAGLRLMVNIYMLHHFYIINTKSDAGDAILHPYMERLRNYS